MPYQVTFILLTITVFIIEAKELDPGPQLFSNSNSSATQKPHKRFATKEVIVYLTPSQIRDLETGKAELQTSPEGETNKPTSDEDKIQNPQLLYNSHLENLNILKAPVVQELLENKHQVQHAQNYFTPNLQPQNHDEQFNQPFYNPDIQSKIPNQSNNVRIPGDTQSEWVPIAPVTERQAESYSVQELSQQWQNNEAISKDQLNTNVLQPPAPQLQYASNYDSQYVLEQGNAFRLNSAVENQRALAQASAIDNSLPIVIHKEVQITKHKPVPVVHRVNVPVATPFFVPILHPYEVKVPQPYPVPIKIIKHVPVPVIQTEKTKVEKYIPYPLKNSKSGNNAHTRVYADHPLLQGWKH